MSKRYRYRGIQWLKRVCQHYWIPLLLGMLATIAVLGIWQQLWVQEQLHIEQLVQQEAHAVESGLNRELSTRISALQRMASRWQSSGGTPQALWQADATNFVRDFYSYQAIEWVDPSFKVRWVVPLQGNETAVNLDLSQEPRRQIALGIARDLRQTILTNTISLAQGGKGFLVCIPLLVHAQDSSSAGDRFDGFIVGVFRFETLFSSILPISPRYKAQIYDHTGLIYSQGTPSSSRLSKMASVQAYGADWRVQVFPTSELVSEGRSLLPALVLTGGLAGAWALAFVVGLGQRSKRQTRQTRLINQQLQNEIFYRQQIEAELRASEERWQLALRGNNDGIWDWDLQTQTVFFSSRWKEMLGFAESEISNHLDEWSKRVHPDDLQSVIRSVSEHLAQKTPFYVSEHRIQCKDGSYKWILDRGQALWNEFGRGIRMTGSHTDITERKQAEIALQESEAKYRNLIDHLNTGFVVYAPDARILQCNAAACELFGLSMAQMLGQVAIDPDWHFVREDGSRMPAEEYPLHRVLSTHDSLKDYVFGIHRVTQPRAWVLSTAFPEFDADRQLKQVVVILIDISKLKRTETDLREVAEVMENAISGISKLDAQGRYLYVNKAYADVVGYAPEEMMGMPWHQTIYPGDLEQMQSAYQRMVQEGKVEIEAKGIRKNGSNFYQQLVMIAIYDEQPKFIGHYCFVKDISDRKRTEAALRQSEEKFRQLAENIRAVFWMADPSVEQVLYVSPAYEEIWGQPCEELYRNFSQWFESIHPDDRLRVEQAQINDVFQGTYNEEYRIIRPDGSIRWIHDRSFVIKNQPLTARRIAGIAEDITTRKRIEIALEKELLHSKALFNTSIDGIVVLNLQGNVLQASPSFAQMLGYTLEETLLLNAADWDIQWTREELRQLRATHAIPPVFETRHRRQDGSFYDVEVSYSRVELEGEMVDFCICRDISDRKRIEAERQHTEEALRRSEARFQAFMNHSPAAAWITDDDGVILYASQTYPRTFQLPTQDLLGRSILEVYPAEVAQQFLNNIQTVACTHAILETVEVAPRLDGTMGDFLVYKFPIPDGSDRILIGGVAIDITLQRRAEEALRQSEATKKAIIQAIPDLLIRMRLDGTGFELISSADFCLMPPEGIWENTNVYDVLPPDLAQLRLHHTQQALQSGTTQIYEQEIFIQGNHRYEEVRIVPLLQDEVLAMVRDITDRKQAEEALRYQKEMLQAIVNHIPVMIALFNQQAKIELINPELERRLGWSLADWQQQDVLSICYPDLVQRQSALDHMLAATGHWKDVTVLSANGQPLETSWANVRLSGGQYLSIGQDISDRKHKEFALQRAMEAAEAANLAKSLFLANMSHELRTPLNVILGFTQVMAHDPSLTPSQQEDLQTIRRSGDHLLSLINDVLDLSKIEAGHCTLAATGFDLSALLHTLHTMMAERAASKRLQLEFNLAPEVPQFVIADEQKLRQVLLNLVSNAIKFTDRGTVRLLVSQVDHSPSTETSEGIADGRQTILQFDVSDTGVGIAPEAQDTIFDAFVQAEAGRKSSSGTGLGLTISRKLLELMQGEISVHSIPNVGSTFTFTLPVGLTSGIIIPPEQHDRLVIGLMPGQSHRRILVVDDQRENRLVLVRRLTQVGLDVQEAADGYEAIRIWQSWHPDLTWMDIRMPGLDGYEATKRIRAMEQEAMAQETMAQNQPSIIIALTAQASQSDRTLALAAGCNDYVSKPFREETLFMKLQEYLGLEYLYAEAEDILSAALPPSDAADLSLLFDPDLLSQLPADWLEALEDAAVCGNDRTIAQLVLNLPPEFAALGMQLINLASKFQFEKIVQLIER